MRNLFSLLIATFLFFNLTSCGSSSKMNCDDFIGNWQNEKSDEIKSYFKPYKGSSPYDGNTLLSVEITKEGKVFTIKYLTAGNWSVGNRPKILSATCANTNDVITLEIDPYNKFLLVDKTHLKFNQFSLIKK